MGDEIDLVSPMSVSEGVLARLRKYIRNQEVHHRKQSSKIEYDILFKIYGFTKFEAKAKK